MSLSKNKRRFEESTDEDLARLLKPQVPKNTDVSTRWAMKNFRDWYEDYNTRNPSNRCPEELMLSSCSLALLNKWLCVFVSETRNQNGEKYPLRTIYSLLTGVLRHMRAESPLYPNFLEKNSPADFARSLDKDCCVLFFNITESAFAYEEGRSIGSCNCHSLKDPR